MAKKDKAVIDPYFFDHLCEAGPSAFLEEIPRHPGCGPEIVSSGIVQHFLRCASERTVDETIAFVQALFAEKPDLSKVMDPAGGILEALVVSPHLPDGVRLELLRQAIALGASPHRVEGAYKTTAWLVATQLGNQAALNLFRELAADRPAPTTLLEAVEAADPEAVRRLLATHTKTPADAEALVLAISRRDPIASLLVEQNVGIVAAPGEKSALHEAACRNDVALVRTLLEKGAPIDAVIVWDRNLTPLKYTALLSAPDAFEALLEHKPIPAEELIGDDWAWIWPFMSPRHAQILGRRFGANLVSRKTGLSLLHLAAGGFDAKAIVQELLDGGADPSAGTLAAVLLGGTRFRKGASPLAIAKGLGRNETVAVLEAANEPRPTRSRKPKAARSLRPRGA